MPIGPGSSLRAALLLRPKARTPDAGIVQHHESIARDQLYPIIEPAVPDAVGPHAKQPGSAALGARALRDGLLGEHVVEQFQAHRFRIEKSATTSAARSL